MVRRSSVMSDQNVLLERAREMLRNTCIKGRKRAVSKREEEASGLENAPRKLGT